MNEKVSTFLYRGASYDEDDIRIRLRRIATNDVKTWSSPRVVFHQNYFKSRAPVTKSVPAAARFACFIRVCIYANNESSYRRKPVN